MAPLAVSLEDITPEVAQKILSRSVKSRRLSRRHVDRLAAAMRDGKWRLTHQGIALGPRGALLDGRKRLAAIVASGVTVRMLVARGARRQDFIRVEKIERR